MSPEFRPPRIPCVIVYPEGKAEDERRIVLRNFQEEMMISPEFLALDFDLEALLSLGPMTQPCRVAMLSPVVGRPDLMIRAPMKCNSPDFRGFFVSEATEGCSKESHRAAKILNRSMQLYFPQEETAGTNNMSKKVVTLDYIELIERWKPDSKQHTFVQLIGSENRKITCGSESCSKEKPHIKRQREQAISGIIPIETPLSRKAKKNWKWWSSKKKISAASSSVTGLGDEMPTSKFVPPQKEEFPVLPGPSTLTPRSVAKGWNNKRP